VDGQARERRPTSRTARRLRRTLVGVSALVSAAVVAVVVVDQVHVPAPAARPYPSAWSRAAEPLAASVAAAHGTGFDHPVRVDLMTPDDYDRRLARDASVVRRLPGSGYADAVWLADVAPVLLATGVLSGDDVPAGGLAAALGSVVDARAAQVRAYWSAEDRRVRVDGTQLDPTTGPLLVEQLTRVLADQSAARRSTSEPAPGAQDPQAAAARDAVLAGDSSRAAAAWVATLTAPERRAVAREAARGAAGSGTAAPAAGLPPSVVALLAARPRLGRALVDLAVRRGGPAAAGRLLSSPPRSDADLVDPRPAVPGGKDGGPAPAPPPEAGEVQVTATGEAGPLLWYAVLAQRLPLPRALAATDAIVGDAWSAYEIDDRACVTMRARVADRAALDRLGAAVAAWARARPGAPVVTDRAPGALLLSTCAPDGQEPPLPGGVDDRVGPAVALAVARAGLVDDGRVPLSRPGATRCYTDAAVAEIAPDDLTARPRTVITGRRLDALAARCLR